MYVASGETQDQVRPPPTERVDIQAGIKVTFPSYTISSLQMCCMDVTCYGVSINNQWFTIAASGEVLFDAVELTSEFIGIFFSGSHAATHGLKSFKTIVKTYKELDPCKRKLPDAADSKLTHLSYIFCGTPYVTSRGAEILIDLCQDYMPRPANYAGYGFAILNAQEANDFIVLRQNQMHEMVRVMERSAEQKYTADMAILAAAAKVHFTYHKSGGSVAAAGGSVAAAGGSPAEAGGSVAAAGGSMMEGVIGVADELIRSCAFNFKLANEKITCLVPFLVSVDVYGSGSKLEVTATHHNEIVFNASRWMRAMLDIDDSSKAACKVQDISKKIVKLHHQNLDLRVLTHEVQKCV
jgi:hypothetical protein